MRALRHRVGRWLLRDAKPLPGNYAVVVTAENHAREIRAALLRLKRERGGGSLGLS